LPCCLN